MSKGIKITIILLVSYCLGFGVGSFLYKLGNSYNEIVKNENNFSGENKDLIEVSTTSYKVTENTVIVFEYFDINNNFIKSLESLPPYYLVGLTREDMEELFADWSLISFSEEKIILQKYLNEETYFLSVYDGNIAIFSNSDKNKENLIEILNKPIVSFPKDEQEKIISGIYIYGKSDLIKYIQDYES